ncbi:aminotransferase class V-fold PLP-dependent enzyme, partial [uncultured Variovorax sp.]|uniref:aminotransferase class V-fold PLP-dependent enzyme n=1 Tax=uncultured Variovorax sp. TaxID=114708 RepID=UPI0025DC5808
MASAMFSALPGTPPDSVPGVASGLVPGAQFPANVAPAGSPLASPAGFGPSVPGTPFPQGQVPGANLVPASPMQVPSLANRAPALVPHAVAGNGVPDSVLSVAPAFEPRSGGTVQGVPQLNGAAAPQAAASSFYFLDNGYGHPSAGATPVVSPPLPLAGDGWGEGQRTTQGAGLPLTPTLSPEGRGSEPRFYFVDAVRLPSGFVTPAKPDPRGPNAVPLAGSGQHPPFDIHAVRRDFPILQERVNGKQLVWFDNAATTHKPQSVIDRISYFYEHENSNIHRAAHELAARATDAYEGARERVRRFINAPEVEEVIFVRGTTEAINLVAKSWGGQHVGEGDEIVVSNLEHHANIVPWQQLAAAKGAKLRVIPMDDSGQVLLDEYRKLLNDRTKIVAVTQVSNALGTVVPVKEIVELAHRAGAKALVDGAQSVSHMRVDVQDIGADFFVFSGHKVFGPTGIGVVWGKREVLEDMPPWQGGGNMIADVTFEKTVFQPIPNKFEAGTGNIADAVGLGAAIDYVNKIGIENIARYEHDLLVYGMAQLGAIPG